MSHGIDNDPDLHRITDEVTTESVVGAFDAAMEEERKRLFPPELGRDQHGEYARVIGPDDLLHGLSTAVDELRRRGVLRDNGIQLVEADMPRFMEDLMGLLSRYGLVDGRLPGEEVETEGIITEMDGLDILGNQDPHLPPNTHEEL
jgi:hypothetical protein